MTAESFAERLLEWFDHAGRHDLPWQHPRSAYRVWISEVMLQQTQVATVIPYFERFLARFPDLAALASASVESVLEAWSGLGYYSRGRNLHRAAQVCVRDYGGELPDDVKALMALPGIGRSTAAAILTQAFGQRAAILDGNVKRILTRHAGIEGDPGRSSVERQLWALAEQHLPNHRLADYTQAVMDLGATICTPRQPRCEACPVRHDCIALSSDRVAHLPSPKQRKSNPVRAVTMLVLTDAKGRVCFERRPPFGIWGGMLGLPEFPDETAAHAHLTEQGLRIRQSHIGPRLRHVFTHFRLDITPLGVQADGCEHIAEDRREWHAPEVFATLALPTAVRRVLEFRVRSLS